MPKIEKYVYYIFSENISSVCNPMQVVDFLKFFFSFYHNKIDPVTNYKAIKNKINKTRHHRQQDTHTHTHTQRKWDEITPYCPLPFHFKQTINQSYDQ